MPHFVIAPLEASPADLARIDAVRALHDPQHRIVPPHVTLVFGFDAPELGVVAEHVGRIAARQPPIVLRLAEHRAVRDHDGVGSHVFMTLGEGDAEVVALHDALYAGPLSEALRHDIAFTPHVTVAAAREHGEAEALARSLGGADVRARLTRLELATLERGVLTISRRFELAGSR
jgi:2'-5' RNA ligase